MADEEHLKILKQGVEVWNRWREENPSVRPDLSSADLVAADLVAVDLEEAYLHKADLRKACLRKANLGGACLNGADLSGADLDEADLGEADLSEADLSGAYLNEAYLNGAYFFGTDLTQANLTEAYLNAAYLRGACLDGANLNGADLSEATLRQVMLRRVNLTRADLRWARLLETDFSEADLSGCYIYGVSAWDLNLEGATQSNLIVSRDDEPVITVDDLEVAQFIYLLLNYRKLRNVLNAVTERGVLILGRFGEGGLELLQAVAAQLREFDYLPIIFEFDRPESRNITETIKTLAGLSRFVIADLSGPSVPQELDALVPHFKIPFVPIIEKGRKEYAMFRDILEYPWVLKPVEFENEAQLLKLLPGEIIDPAEEKHQERQKKLDELFKEEG